MNDKTVLVYQEYDQNSMPKLCTCARSATGFCTGLHRLSNQEWDARVFDEAFVKQEKTDHES